MTDLSPRARPPYDPFASGSAELDPSGAEARRNYAARIPAGLRVDLDTCFLGGAGAKITKKNQARLELLEKASSVLQRCLAPRDRVKLIANAHEHIWWEAFVAGQWATLMNRSILAITEEKVLVIRCDRRSNPIMYVNQIPFTAVKKVGGLLASLSLTTAGQTRKFRLDRNDRKEIEALIRVSEGTARGDLEHLCPSCFTPSAAHVDHCASCGLEISSPQQAFARSLLLPGLGAFKLGAKGFGTLQMIRAGMLWLMILVFAAVALGGDSSVGWAALFLAVFTAFIHVTDALATRALARRGLIAPDTRLPTSGSLSR